jgi:type II secretory pathway pseudopilin PulG
MESPHPKLKSSQAAFSLLEAMISLVVVIVALMSMASSVVASNNLQNRSRESSMAARQVSAIHEIFRNGSLDATFAFFKDNPISTEESLVIQVEFPEEIVADQLGTAIPVGWRFRDLDADGIVELDPAATETVSLLPIRVTVTWPDGNQVANFLVTER